MPHKFNADRRDKIPKQKQRLTNWSEDNEGLRRRGACWLQCLFSSLCRVTADGEKYRVNKL